MPAVGEVSPGQVMPTGETIAIFPYRLIGPFSAHVTLREVHTDELEITDQPVEMGASITDHSYKRPAELEVECAWSNSPQQTYTTDGKGQDQTGSADLTGNGIDNVREVYQKLLELQASREPFDVYTGKRVYYDMLIKRLVTRSDKENEKILSVVFNLRQVIIVKTQVLVIDAPAEDQADPESTQPSEDKGTKQLSDDSSTFNAEAADASLQQDPVFDENGQQVDLMGADLSDIVFEVPTSPVPQNFDIDLGAAVGALKVDLQWCKDAGAWCTNLSDSAGKALVQGLPLITGGDLLGQFEHLGIPGKLLAQTTFDPTKVPGFKELGNVGKLFFVKG